VLTDEEYLTEAMRHRRDEGSGEAGFDRTVLVRWTPEVRVLADLVDEIRRLRATVVGLAGGGAKEPARYDRPRTALDKVRHGLAREKHEKLVNRVLPNRTGD
jgi:hypothetical protein